MQKNEKKKTDRQMERYYRMCYLPVTQSIIEKKINLCAETYALPDVEQIMQ